MSVVKLVLSFATIFLRAGAESAECGLGSPNQFGVSLQTLENRSQMVGGVLRAEGNLRASILRLAWFK